MNLDPQLLQQLLASSAPGTRQPQPGYAPPPQPGQMVPERPLRMGPTGGPFGMSGETLDNVARAVLQASQQFQPRNDFEGFLGGLAGGLAGGRVQDMHQRGQFNLREQDRADMRTQANVKSEDERRQFVRSAASSLASHRQQLIRDRMQAEARAAAEQTAYERELPDKRAARESNERVARIHASNKGGGGGVERFDDMTKLDVQSVREFYQPQVSAAHGEVKRLKDLRAKAGSLGGKREVLAATGAKDVPSAISALDAEISKAQAEAVRVGQEMKQAVREAAAERAAEAPSLPAGAPAQAAPTAPPVARDPASSRVQVKLVRAKMAEAKAEGESLPSFVDWLRRNAPNISDGFDVDSAVQQAVVEWGGKGQVDVEKSRKHTNRTLPLAAGRPTLGFSSAAQDSPR